MRSKSRPQGHVGRTFIEDARRSQIIACAIDALAELGYAHTSLARIAERAGVSKGVISYHFAGKEELLVQVVLAVHAAGAEYMRPRIAAETTAPAMLATYLRSNLEYIRDQHQQIAAVTEVMLNLRKANGALRFVEDVEAMEPAIEGVQGILHKGQQDGDFRAFDTRAMAWAVRNVIDGVNQQRAIEPAFDFAASINEITALFDRATCQVST